MWIRRFVLTVVCAAIPALAFGQSPIANPTKGEFTASVDHAAVTSYEFGWFLTGAVDPVSTVDVGKPAPDTAGVCFVTINVQPLTFGVYTAKARAKAGTLYSEWSDPSNAFARVPGKPSKLVIK